MALILARLGVIATLALLGSGIAGSIPLGRGTGALAGAAAGVVAVGLEAAARRVPLPRLAWGSAGALAGVVGGLCLGTAVAPLFPGAGPVVASAVALAGAWVGGAVGARRAPELPGFARRAPDASERVLDTSVIIDGRIAEIVDAGFLDGALVVPQFVLRELQRLADSGDAVRRNRGRRGFEVLERLRKSPNVRLTMPEAEGGAGPVDDRLVAVAQARGARLLTNDAGLGRLASLAGVAVASLNDLALALKPAVVPGEAMQVHVVREGKEVGQGVGYLDDGTMVVVEGGKRFIGQPLDVVVTSMLQTSAGRMIFSRPRAEEAGRDA